MTSEAARRKIYWTGSVKVTVDGEWVESSL